MTEGKSKKAALILMKNSDFDRTLRSHRQKLRLKHTKLYGKNISTIETFGEKKF